MSTTTRPQACPETLAQQIATTRQSAARCANLVRAMPGSPCREIDALATAAAGALGRLEVLARTHQPTRRAH